VIKAAICDPQAPFHAFPAQKTMYGGKAIAAGDTIYLFASENAGGRGLVARGVVVSAEGVPPLEGIARQTPRVSIGAEHGPRASSSAAPNSRISATGTMIDRRPS
jgi:hypothetical protein